jgi:uncharacterized protein (TIGR02001 family)
MKKIVLSVVAALALSAAPAFAADMPVKALKAPAAAPSPWDIAFGASFTSDYVLRGISQTNRRPAGQGYFELDYTASDWLKLYAGLWGSALAAYNADAEIDISGGARFSWGNFGLDLGYVYYYYPDGTSAAATCVALGVVCGYDSFGEFYAKPSYKFNDWLSVGAIFDGGDNFNNGLNVVGSKRAYYYSGNATITLPASLMPGPITVSINPEIGRQVFECTGCVSYNYYDVGLDFNYKVVTLDLRYWNTNASGAYLSVPTYGSKNLSGPTFVATLKFDTTLSALK